MTELEKIWFAKLSVEHANDARTFAKPEYRGVWNSVINKYSDNAHFVYELLQNADDAGATEASFTLSYGVGIFFEHNGTKHFTISNPDTSDEDQRMGRLGCVNAISAIGQSAKIVEEGVGNQIGKFGIGFKSVFRYTDTPKIYDDNIQFELRDRIVPCLIDDLPNLRKPGRTLFVLPFRKQSDAHVFSQEIEDSILKLKFPLLFLNHLKCISCQSFQGEAQRGHSVYRKEEFAEEVVILPNRENVQTRTIRITAECGGVTNTEDIRTMSRTNSDGRKYEVGFLIDANGRPVPSQQSTKAFCYFQTDVDTWLNFYIHAPFRLVDNRQGIINDRYNCDLVAKLSILAADSVLVFKQLGMLDENVFLIFPNEVISHTRQAGLFGVFAIPFVQLCATEAIYKATNGFVSLEHAKWAGSTQIADLLPTPLLRELYGAKDEWVFGFTPDDYAHEKNISAIKKWLPSEKILSLAAILNKLTKNFVERRGFPWLNELYGLILKNHSLTDSAKVSPIIIDSDGHAVAAKNAKGENAIYLPIEIDSEFPTVHPGLFQQSNAESFFQRIGLRRPSRMDAIKKIIVDKIPKANGREEYNRLFNQVLDFYVEQKGDERQTIIKLLRENPCLAVKDFDDMGKDVGCSLMKKGEIVYFPNDELAKYFKALGVRCVDWERYIAMTGDKAVVDSLLTKIGVFKDVRFWRNSKDEPSINMCMHNLRRIMSLPLGEQKQLSVVIWHILCNVVSRCCSRAISFQQLMTCVHHNAKAPSPTLQMLRSTKWLINNNGAMVASNEVWRENLAAEYDLTSWQSIQIIEALQIKRNPELVAIETLTDENRAALELGQKLRAAGFEKEVGAGVSAEKLGLLLQLEEKFTEEEIKMLLNDRTEAKRSNSGVAGDTESPSVDGQQLQGWSEETGAVRSDVRFTEDDAEQMKRVFGNTLTDAEMNDINRIDCIRLFNSLMREGLEPRMLLGRDECQIECEYGDDTEDDSKREEKVERDFVADVYKRRISRRSSMKDTRGAYSSTIETKDGRQIHVIGAIGGVAHLPPKWWNRIAGQGCPEKAKYIVCAIVSHRENGFRYLRTRDDLMRALGDNFSVVRVQSETIEDRFEKTCSLFATNPEQSDYSTYALLLFHEMAKKYSYEGVFKVDFENMTEAECNGADDSEFKE